MLILRSDGTTIASDSWIPVKPDVAGNCYYSESKNTDAPVVLTVDDINTFQEFVQLPHLILELAVFSDGRMFSISSQLRMLGYKGKLTLIGDVLPDQVSYAFRCGIDEIQFLDEHKCARAQKLVTPFAMPYRTF